MTWAAIISTAAKVGVSYAASRAASRGRNPTSAVSNFRPSGFTTSGLSATPISNGQFDVTTSPLRTQLLQKQSDSFGKQAQGFKDLLPKFEGGIGSLTNAALSSLENSRRRSIGNLRENLQRRRVLGSSFAQDALARANAEFGQKSAEVKAAGLLQEAEAKMKLLTQIHQTERNQSQVFIDNMNLEAELGTQITSGVTSALAQNAQFQSKAQLGALADRNAFFRPLIQSASTGIGNAVGNYFSGTG